tara:strand:+ start:2145 stop:3260 length:1116 start_codon:yes stop_codon:yes gene_type:complete
MKNIKELIILYPSFERGGVEKNLINFANSCDNQKIKIYLISNISKTSQKKFFKKNINFISVKLPLNIKSFKRFFTSLSSISTLLDIFKYVKKENSLIVSFQSHVLPIILCKLFKRKIVLRNSEDIIEATKYADNKVSASFIFLLKIFFYNFADGVITNSKKAKKSLDLITLNTKKNKLIYNPYLYKVFYGKKNFRKNIILSVGRFCKQKNQEITIKAFSLFLKNFPNYKLVLIGDGLDRHKLKRLCLSLKISKNVIFKGWVLDIKKYYLESKILIFPSLYEGLPNTLIEATNYNLPCISSKCSGAPDILTKKFGNFSSRNNHVLLSEKMIDSISNYKKTLLYTQIIKKKLSRFLVKPQVSKYISFCNSILD